MRSKSLLYRSRKRVRKLINLNINRYSEKDKIAVFAFDYFCDRDKAVRIFKLYIQKLRRKFGNEFEYIAFIDYKIYDKVDFVKCFYVLLFNFKADDVEKLILMWDSGEVKVDILNESNYIADLLCGLMNENNLDHKKSFFSSKQNLIRWGIEDEKWIF